MSTYRWTLIGRIPPDGHKLFRDEVSGRRALADNSGGTPDRTDCGVLWLDVSQPVKLIDAGKLFMVPVSKEGVSGEFVVGDPIAGWPWFHKHTGMRIVVPDAQAELWASILDTRHQQL